MRWLAVLFIIGTTVLPLLADDWTTVDGTTYKNVVVVKAEDDGVNINYDGGSTKVPYYNLPVEIQKQFGQDPETLAATKKAAEAAEANRIAAEQEAKKIAEDQKKQAADDVLQLKALNAARAANVIELSEASLRVPDTTTYPGADYSYSKYTDNSYLDSPPAVATPLPAPTTNDPLVGHASLTLRAVSVGPKPEQPDKYLGEFLSVSPLRKFTDNHQVIFLVDGLTMTIAEADMKDADFITGAGQVAEYVSFYLTPKQVDEIVNAKSVKLGVGVTNYTLGKDELAKLKTYTAVLAKDVPPPSSMVGRKLHEFVMSMPPISILISDVCIYILTGSFTIVVFVGITACFVGASRFFKM